MKDSEKESTGCNLQMNVPADLLDQISGIGKAEDRTRNGQILWLLKDGVQRYQLSHPDYTWDLRS